MSYRYKQADVREKDLLDAEQVRGSLVEQISSLQALDRDQIPHNHIGDGKIASGAMHQMLSTEVNKENAPPYRFTDPSTRPAVYNFLPAYVYPPGVMFRNYAGGGVILCDTTIICKGGVIQAEFSCWTWRETYPDYANENELPSMYSLTMKLNGREIAETATIASNWSNMHLVGTAVAPEGAVQVTVEWAFTGLDTAGLAGQTDIPQFCVGGTALLVQNRRT